MSAAARDRRAMYGASTGRGPVDPESLERDNDRGIDALSDRVALLKQATFGIRNEAEAQHSILDRMADSMGGARGMLGGAADKFKLVMADKQNKRVLMLAGGMAALVLILWYFMRR